MQMPWSEVNTTQKALNEKLTTAMRAAIYKKPAAHCFEHPEEMTEINEMVKIGG